MKIAIQGEKGAFSHICVTKLYQDFQLVECKWFDELFLSLTNGTADLAVCPIENSIAGTIIQTYDLIAQYPEINVIGEYYLRIEHNLIANQGVELKDIKKVYSHPMAIRQCQDYLNKSGLQVIESDDTAGSVRMIVSKDMQDSAAIASKLASEIYHAQILVPNVETDKNNYTRFWVLSRKPVEQPNSDKVSLLFSLKHEAGSLARVLNIFASANINLTKIESRPKLGKAWEYYFFCDLYSERGEEYILQSLDLVADNVLTMRVLGKYKQADLNLH